MIDKILKDWNDRVGGNLNHKKESHLFELGSMLWEQGWNSEQIAELVKNLKEQETKFKGRTKDGDLRYFKSKDSLDKALEKGTNSICSNDSLFRSTRGSIKCESWEVSPCPGKCLPTGTVPAS